ncbi:hypothetical protein RvVAT039_pl11910 (plasmid) [Agrobacterium vitis]|uniref:three component ABC system middle component n=1 Tax=Agrobacterium TaxID=357 RepID=UPI001574AEDB|nr:MULTISPECIES: three component ABC system middle component [Agrobacterium]MDX8316076.1 DUF6521 family protein [Agrobacterium rosae]WCK17218.1 DUF6521 family protein [Agrobacterium tumefaciens]BCH62665.1 hypothetical protein RvVAR0630_pl08070 [Agrobacterium vitis]BCH68358.1 hypothetical protein RvVAT039_pl11910 [Agrobacterium vitis]
MRANHEELILRNPVLGACLFWQFARTFAESRDDDYPTLPLFFIVAAMLFHKPTVEKAYRMNFESGILKAISDRPDIIAGLQSRMEDYSKSTLLTLQVAASAKLLSRVASDGMPSFRAIGNELPRELRRPESPVTEMLAASKRLGAWFASESSLAVQRHLRVEF